MERSKQENEIPETVELLLGNRQALVDNFGLREALYTPPSRNHYPHCWLWDGAFADIVLAREGYNREAITSFFSIVQGQRPNGMIPNMVFAPKGRKLDPERYSFMDPLKSSDYSQPPVLALSAKEIFESLDQDDPQQAETFLRTAYPYLAKFYGYFENNRQNGSDDPLIGVIHPHETGRDSDPTFNFFKHKLPRQGADTPQLIDKINMAADYTSVIALNYRQRLKGWDEQKVRRNFWVNDVMFNCVYADNLYEMANLASRLELKQDSARFAGQASQVEQAILNDMWFPEARGGQGSFYALNQGAPILETSVSNLFPLVLPNLKPEQLDSILSLFEKSFDTPYPIPSVAIDSPNYNPHYRQKGRLWDGGTWINTNWYLVERGKQRQAVRSELQAHPRLVQRAMTAGNKVVDSSHSLVDQGFYEFYNPETGEPYRVEHFAWSALARLLKTQNIATEAIAA